MHNQFEVDLSETFDRLDYDSDFDFDFDSDFRDQVFVFEDSGTYLDYLQVSGIDPFPFVQVDSGRDHVAIAVFPVFEAKMDFDSLVFVGLESFVLDPYLAVITAFVFLDAGNYLSLDFVAACQNESC